MASKQSRASENFEMGTRSSSTLVVVDRSDGKTTVKKCWLWLLGLLIVALVGLCIGLYFIGFSDGSANVSNVVVVTQPAVISTSSPITIQPSTNLDYRLPRNALPLFYKIALLPDLYGTNASAFTISGWEIITIKVQFPTDRIFLHAERMEINTDKVQLFESLPDDQEPLPNFLLDITGSDPVSNISLLTHFHHQKFAYYEFVFNTTLQVREYKLRLEWKGPLLRDLYGLYLSQYTDDNDTLHYLAATQFQPTHARKAFPCFDEPDLKAVFQARLIRKSTHSSLFNTDNEKVLIRDGIFPIYRHIPRAVTINGEGYFMDYFVPTVHMSSYLVAFAVHDFVLVEGKNQGRSPIEYRYWGRPGWQYKMQFIAEVGQPILEKLDNYYGAKYPLNKLDMIAIPDFAAGAMENFGLITYTEGAFYFDPVYDAFSQKDRVAAIVAHELGHTQFGNIVTCKWWNDIYLNEGFASYVEYIGVSAIPSLGPLDERYLIDDALRAMRVDCLNSTRPISQAVDSPGSISSMFDTISYQKGASLYNMISGFMTEESFRKALNVYLLTFQYNNTEHKNLYDTLTGYSVSELGSLGLNVREIMEGWTVQPGYPVVTVTTVTRGTGRLTLAINQEPFELDKGQFADRLWQVPITMYTSTNINFDTTNRQWLKVKSASLGYTDSSVDGNWAGWYILNAKHSGYFRVNYDAVNWGRLQTQLFQNHSMIDVLARTQLVDDAYYLARGNYLATGYILAFNITSYLCNELNYAPWSATLYNLNYIERMLTFTEYNTKMKSYGQMIISSIYNAVGWIESSTENTNYHFLRTNVLERACSWDLPDCLTQSRFYFVRWQQNFTAIIPLDATDVALCYGIETGTSDDWWWLYNFYAETSAHGDRATYIGGLACSTNITALEWFLNVSYTSDSIPIQEFPTIFTAVASNPEANNMSRQFFFNNWQSIIFEPKTFTTPRKVMESAFQYVNTQEGLQELLDWKKQAGDLGASEDTYNDVVVTIESNIAWMNAHMDEVGAWITAFDENPTLPSGCSTTLA